MTFSHMPKSVYSITLEKPGFVYTKTPVREERHVLSVTFTSINCSKII